jgi:hypothetical protein
VAPASAQHGTHQRTTAASARVTSAAVTVASVARPPNPTTRASQRCGPTRACGAIQTSAHHSAPTAVNPAPTSRQAVEMPARRATVTPAQVSAWAAVQPSSSVTSGTGQATCPSDSPPARATLSGPR